MRIELTVEYLGYGYAGYQRQKNAMTVQQELEESWRKLTGERVTMTGAGRTDAGVSALGQRVHFDTKSTIPPGKICFAMNTRLPEDIRVTASREHEGFHARYDARGKLYRYTVINTPHASALLFRTAWHIPQKLHVAAMREAARYMTGKHDFSAFCAAGAQTKTTVRTLYAIDIAEDNGTVTLSFCGDGFLYNMVRIMTGTLVAVGKGKLAPGAIPDIIDSGGRESAGATAPPQGLCLVEVYYDNNFLGEHI